MLWIKPRDRHYVYEALSAIADKRFELVSENEGKCTSTSKGKYYTVNYDPSTNSIMSNDNMAYYVGEISYPMVAILLLTGTIPYDTTILPFFKDIKWKEINQKNKNNYMKSVMQVLEELEKKGVDIKHIDDEAQRIFDILIQMELQHLGRKVVPPKAY